MIPRNSLLPVFLRGLMYPASLLYLAPTLWLAFRFRRGLFYPASLLYLAPTLWFAFRFLLCSLLRFLNVLSEGFTAFDEKKMYLTFKSSYVLLNVDLLSILISTFSFITFSIQLF